MRRVTWVLGCVLASATGVWGQDSRPASGPASGATSQPAASSGGIAARVEAAHGGRAWDRQEVVVGRLRVVFGGAERIVGTMTFAPHSNLMRYDLDDGGVLVWDGEAAWVSPAGRAFPPGARFHLQTWTYFLAAPFKLNDPGVQIEEAGQLPLDGEDMDTYRMTFAPGTGDAPDDWYVLYLDPQTHRLEGMSYIVTYGGQSVESAEEEPHAVRYLDYVDVDGVMLSTRWTFHDWSEAEGFTGALGEVTVTDLRFETPEEDPFVRPDGSEEDALPGGE